MTRRSVTSELEQTELFDVWAVQELGEAGSPSLDASRQSFSLPDYFGLNASGSGRSRAPVCAAQVKQTESTERHRLLLRRKNSELRPLSVIFHSSDLQFAKITPDTSDPKIITSSTRAT